MFKRFYNLMLKKSKYTWLLDAGHGGLINGVYQTAGKRSPVWENGTQYFEGVGNREIVAKICKQLDVKNIPYFDILKGSDEDISLKERVRRVNSYQQMLGNCVLVSIHSDAFTKESANGYSIYTSIGTTKSDAIAEVFLKNMIDEFKDHKLRKDSRDGDLDKESNFYVLRKTTCPAILIENFFMTNKRECELLLSNEGKNRIADCHVKSITELSFN